MKIGDLICYNAAGQKNKTIGLVVDIQVDFGTKNLIALIQWGDTGNGYLPRTAGPDLYRRTKTENIRGGDMVWHHTGSWFEVIE